MNICYDILFEFENYGQKLFLTIGIKLLKSVALNTAQELNL